MAGLVPAIHVCFDCKQDADARNKPALGPADAGPGCTHMTPRKRPMSAVLEAKDAIRELMATYAMALDACRFADVAACFAPDGEWTTSYGAARGPAEIEKFISGIVPVKGE